MLKSPLIPDRRRCSSPFAMIKARTIAENMAPLLLLVGLSPKYTSQLKCGIRDYEPAFGLSGKQNANMCMHIYSGFIILAIVTYRSTQIALNVANEKGLKYNNENLRAISEAKHTERNCLPSIMDKTIEGYITYVSKLELTDMYIKIETFNIEIITVLLLDS